MNIFLRTGSKKMGDVRSVEEILESIASLEKLRDAIEYDEDIEILLAELRVELEISKKRGE